MLYLSRLGLQMYCSSPSLLREQAIRVINLLSRGNTICLNQLDGLVRVQSRDGSLGERNAKALDDVVFVLNLASLVDGVLLGPVNGQCAGCRRRTKHGTYDLTCSSVASSLQET